MELGRAIDAKMETTSGTNNPLKVAKLRSVEAVDEDFADEVCMGKTICDADPSSVHANATAHALSAAQLGLTKKFHVQKRWHSIMRRYFLAGRRAFSDVDKYSQTVDGSRFQIDTMCGLLGGLQHDGALKVQWCSPQAFILCC